MPFVRPTLQELIDRARGDIRSELGVTAIVRRRFLAAIARVQAGVGHSNHGHLKEISKQAFPDQAVGIILQRWSAIYGVQQRPATFTTLTISGTGSDGSVMSLGTIFQIDSGETYLTDSAVTVGPAGGFATGVYTVSITAVNSGTDTNLADAETVTLQSPVAGIGAVATVDTTVTEGEALETESALQARVVQRIQEPPAGGKASDYIAFALTVSGVSRAFVFPGNRGQGTVDTSFLELDAGDVEVIPGPAKVAEVQAAVDALKPVTANHITFAPTASVVDLTIALKPNTPEVRAAVEAEVSDLFDRESQVGGALDLAGVGSTHDGIIPLSQIGEAISLAAGEDDHIISLPTVNPDPGQGGILRVGTFTFTTLV